MRRPQKGVETHRLRIADLGGWEKNQLVSHILRGMIRTHFIDMDTEAEREKCMSNVTWLRY